MCDHCFTTPYSLLIKCSSLLHSWFGVDSRIQWLIIEILKQSPSKCFHLTTYMVSLSIFLMTWTDAAKPPLQHSSIAENRLMLQDRAILHINLMNTMGLCREPRPLILYPEASATKIYYPRGTLVHRCTDQTGCCPNPGELCRPETVETIEKVFFVNHLILGQKVSAGQRIAPRIKAMKSNFTTVTETVYFVNHTSCKCIKLAPNAIEHDDIQSVISRPLVGPNNVLSTSSVLYHLFGVLAVFAVIMISYFIYKFIYISSSRHRNRQLV